MSLLQFERPLSPRERNAALALARALLPSTAELQGADEKTVEATESLLQKVFPEALGPWGALQRSLLATAPLFTRGRSFEQLSPAEAEALVSRWVTHPLLGKIVSPLSSIYKIAHFDRTDLRGGLRHSLGVVEQIEQPRWLEQIHRAEDFDTSEDLECDVVVIGTGAGGAVVGKHLADAGFAVVFVEEGEHYRRNQFGGNLRGALENLYRNTLSVGNATFPIPQGRLVGGSTAVNGGSSFRPPRWVTDRWCEELGSDEFSTDSLETYFERTETTLHVEKADPRYAGPIHEIFERGCKALDWHHDLLSRNAPGCRGEGFCDNGCRTDARRSTNLSYIPPALSRGSLLLTGLRAERLLLEGGRAAGIEGVALQTDRAPARDSQGREKKVRVRARTVILAGGAIASPLFLLSQGLGNSSGQVGKNLTVHPSGPAVGLFDEPIDGEKYIPQADYSFEFLREGILLLSASPVPHMAPPLLSFVGQRLMDLLGKTDHMGGVGYLINDSARGRVRLGPKGLPLLTYQLSREDVQRAHRALVLCTQLLLAAGAREVFPGLMHPLSIRSQEGLARFERMRLQASDLLLTSYHPLGTCKMSRRPEHGVVDLNHQSHDVPGLFVVDGSTVLGPLGVNPQITIMALATRAAEKIGQLISD